MVAAPPQHPIIAHALGPVAATMRGALVALADLHRDARAGPGVGAQRPGATVRVVVGVSGGADSMATLGMLELLQRRLAIELIVAHVDHGLRPGSAAEAELVMATARARGHVAWRQRLVLAPGPGLPARARVARRSALLSAAAETRADLVVLGHTMTDRVESVLLNLCRGAGLAGLATMPPFQQWGQPCVKPEGGPCRREPGLWVRPMMQLEREQTRALAERLGLPFVDDPGNDDDTLPRVRMRQRVLPELLTINGAAIAHIAATADIARDAAALTEMGNQTSGAAASLSSTDLGSIDVLRQLPTAQRRSAILALCRAAGLARDAVAARTLDGIITAMSHDSPHRWDLRGAVLRLAAGRIWIDRAGGEPLTHPMVAVILPEPGRNA